MTCNMIGMEICKVRHMTCYAANFWTGLAKLDIPMVCTLHDYWPITGHYAYSEEAGCEKCRIHCEDCLPIGRHPQSYIDSPAKNFLEKQSSTMGWQTFISSLCLNIRESW